MKIRFILVSMLAAFCCHWSYGQIDLSNALLVHYPFDDPNGAIITNDVSGNGNDANVIGATLANDRFGNQSAYEFDAADEYLVAADASAGAVASSFTLSAWINMQVAGAGTVVSKNGHSGGYRLGINGSSKLYLQFATISHNNASSLSYQHPDALPLSQWVHVAGVFDAATNTCRIYVDGVINSSQLDSSVQAQNEYTSEPLRVGNNHGYQFNGFIDEVRVYDRALNDAEVLTLHSETVPTVLFTPYGSVGSTVDGNTNVGVGTNDPQALFHVDEGAVLFAGTTGGTPVSGSGTRLMWIPEKAAFRAGQVTGSNWDSTSIGNYSVAMGSNTRASAVGAVAMGTSSWAGAGDAVAIGGGVQATGFRSVAMGDNTKAIGATSIAMGNGAEARKQHTIAMGERATANALRAIALGVATDASGAQSVAIGNSTLARGENATAMGYHTTASGKHATAIGRSTTAYGEAATSIGAFTEADGKYATAIGHYTDASSYASVAIGRYNKALGLTGSWYGKDPVFEVGIGTGTSSANRKNAFTVLKKGTVGVLNYKPYYEVDVWGDAREHTNWLTAHNNFMQQVNTIPDALKIIKDLRGVTYEFNTNSIAYKQFNFPSGTRYGFVGQEVNSVVSELTSKDDDNYYSVNYDGMTPILVEALKQLSDTVGAQDSILDALQQQISDLQDSLLGLKTNLEQEMQTLSTKYDLLNTDLIDLTSCVEKCCGTCDGHSQRKTAHPEDATTVSAAVLYQNVPNPFNEQTSIRYFLPEDTGNAVLVIYNMNGIQMKKFKELQKGEATIEIEAGALEAGMYLYSLLADGEEVATRRMILVD